MQPERIEELIEQAWAHRAEPLPRLFVAGLPDERLGQRLVLVYEQGDSRPNRVITDQEWTFVKNLIQQQLGPYAVPRALIPVALFHQTPTGKIDQQATLSHLY